MYTDLYKPFRKPGSLANEIDNLLHRSIGGPITTGPLTGEWLPPVTVSDSRSEVVYTAELPGLKSEEIEIRIDENVLTIRLEKKRNIEGGDARHHQLGEKFYGSVEQTIQLPPDVMGNYLDARFEAGVLSIKIPKMRKCIHKTVKPKTEADIHPALKSSKTDQVDDVYDEYADYGVMDLMGYSI
jgi:HSP20 family protein